MDGAYQKSNGSHDLTTPLRGTVCHPWASTCYCQRILVENRWSEPKPLYMAPPLAVTQLEFRRDLWHQKTIVPGLSYDVFCVILGLAILVEHRLVTDRQKDTRWQQVPR